MNTLQEKLGFAATDRVLILHADDIGMCHATVTAWQALLDFGLLTSASVMTPCSWAPYAAEVAREYGERADLGVHLTLNSEFPRYRWSPLTGNAAESGLVDEHGYCHSLARFTHAQLDLPAVARELAAQVARAKALGIELTHLDSHMLTLCHPALVDLYLDLCRAHRLPPVLVDDAPALVKRCVIDLEWAEEIGRKARAAADAGDIVLVDRWNVVPFNRVLTPEERLDWACGWLDECKPGVNCLVCHPADDTPELRALAPDWPTRVADRALMASAAFAAEIDRRGFKRVGMRALREALRAG
ncbi:carbohydrate deacetylase [Chitiniphilus shinanonensis]|uniref:Carbohydrate deacetylase n=1 Tax=Chitiniphilus shinanonensis TaxID=553088 RepID=A0ABQ6BQD4_9NEIS|nr:ChbG/HpnK family deacetylase [Chitiniphilus shinanonensis]GLS03526.1 carbohydrate deacetylase [Chitiniphilus shinanonensis]